jgi:hypothetical protein
VTEISDGGKRISSVPGTFVVWKSARVAASAMAAAATDVAVVMDKLMGDSNIAAGDALDQDSGLLHRAG